MAKRKKVKLPKNFINYYELDDGEFFMVEQYEEGELTDQVLMSRDCAMALADGIFTLTQPAI